MRESIIKKYKMTHWIPALVFIIGISMTIPLVASYRSDNKEKVKSLAITNAVMYSERMRDEIQKGVTLTESLKLIIQSAHGGAAVIDDGSEESHADAAIDNFESIAKSLMTDYIGSIQLAPNGIVTTVYPEDGDAGKIDLLNSSGDRGKFSNYAKDHNVVTIQGPYTMIQGGSGIAIRNPVFITPDNDPDSEGVFWGFTIAIIKVPKIFEDSIRALETFGYDFVLSRKSPEITGEKEIVVCQSENEPVEPFSRQFKLGVSTWTIKVAPTDWNKGDNTLLIASVSIVIVCMFTALVLFLLIILQKHNRYKKLALTDELTGLYNRAGFEAEMKKYIDSHALDNCVQATIDIDDFKIINDLYGHPVGDEALKDLAKKLKLLFLAEEAIISRCGGDEFNILIKNKTCDDVKGNLQNFVLSDKSFYANDKKHNYTISLGFVEYPKQGKTMADLELKSDVALYQAKLHGKHACFRYDPTYLSSARSGLGFALNEVTQHLPSAFLIYKADPENDTLLYANNEMVKLAGCDNLDDFMEFSGQKFSNLIRPDEVKAVEKSIWNQINSHKDGSNDYVQFHFARKDGSYKHVFDHGRIVDSTNYGKVFYVLIIASKFIESHYNAIDK